MKRHPDIIQSEDTDNPFAPLTVRTNVSPDKPNVIVQGPFFRVSGDMNRVPLNDFFEHGYETMREFREAAEELISRWHDREGECIEKRLFHGPNSDTIDDRLTLLRLRFHDTPGCRPDEAWIPRYLADPIPVPEYAKWHTVTEYERNKKILTDYLLYGRDDERDGYKRF